MLDKFIKLIWELSYNLIHICLFISLLCQSLVIIVIGDSFRQGRSQKKFLDLFLSLFSFGIIIVTIFIITRNGDYLLTLGPPLICLSIALTALWLRNYAFLIIKKRKSLVNYLLPPILAAIIILAFSGDFASAEHTEGLARWMLTLMPSWIQVSPGSFNGFLRKSWHVLVYCTLYYFWFRALPAFWGLPRWKAAVYSLGLCLVVAVLDEGKQSLVPSRDGNIMDVAWDMMVVTLAALISLIRLRPGRP